MRSQTLDSVHTVLCYYVGWSLGFFQNDNDCHHMSIRYPLSWNFKQLVGNFLSIPFILSGGGGGRLFYFPWVQPYTIILCTVLYIDSLLERMVSGIYSGKVRAGAGGGLRLFLLRLGVILIHNIQYSPPPSPSYIDLVPRSGCLLNTHRAKAVIPPLLGDRVVGPDTSGSPII